MTSPDNELVHHATLTRLTRALRDLHKQLIHVETQYFGAVGSPLEHLQLVANHPHFAWLQKLSGLMAQLDERLDEAEEVTAEEARTFRSAIETLIGPSDKPDTAFQAKYNALLHDAPEIVMAHSAVRKLLSEIARPA